MNKGKRRKVQRKEFPASPNTASSEEDNAVLQASSACSSWPQQQRKVPLHCCFDSKSDIV